MATYTTKFSDNFATEWCNDAASDYAIARRILSGYHPLEPEIMRQFAGQRQPQCYKSGSSCRNCGGRTCRSVCDNT